MAIKSYFVKGFLSEDKRPKEVEQFRSIACIMKKYAKELDSKGKRKYKFSGNRALAKKARGCTVPEPGPFNQRTIVKAMIMKSKPWLSPAQKTKLINDHCKYLQRSHSQPNLPDFFDSKSDEVDIDNFTDSMVDDRHHFRIIVSPENGALADLKSHARGLIREMEIDLRIKLKWMAVVHKDTDHPHIHFVIKGAEKKGVDLLIKPDYISKGVRARSSNLLTLELGPRTSLDIEKGVIKSLQQNRALPIDKKILQISKKYEGIISSAFAYDAETKNMINIRIDYLKKLELVKPQAGSLDNSFQVPNNLIEKLKDIEASSDIYKQMSRFGAIEIKHLANHKGEVVGKVLDKKLSNEFGDIYSIIIDGIDGNKWHMELPAEKAVDIKVGNVVKTKGKSIQVKSVNMDNVVDYRGETFLDKYIARPQSLDEISLSGWGIVLRRTIDSRKEVLAKRNLGKFYDKRFVPALKMLNKLRDIELNGIAKKYKKEGYQVVLLKEPKVGTILACHKTPRTTVSVLEIDKTTIAFIPNLKVDPENIVGEKIKVFPEVGFLKGLRNYSFKKIDLGVKLR